MSCKRELKDRRFGKLVVIRENGRSKGGNVLWECECDCGTIKTINSSHLIEHRTKSCGCSKRKKPFWWIYRYMKSVAKEKHIPMNLSFRQFVSFTSTDKCYYCGSDIKWVPHSTRSRKLAPMRYNLDRVDSNRGYSIKNCVVACGLCNRYKGLKTTEDFISMCGHCKKVLEYYYE